MLKPCSPPGSPQPSMRSSTSWRSRFGTFFSAASTMNAAMSSARSSVNEPLKARPIGVRAVATMTASGTLDSSENSGPGEPTKSQPRARTAWPSRLQRLLVQAAEALAVAGAVLHVLAGTELDHQLRLHRVQAELGRYAERHRASGDLHVVGHQCGRAHQRLLPHDRPVQHDRARTHERTVLDGAALHVHEVADHAVVTDHRRVQQRRMDDAAVLDARAGT